MAWLLSVGASTVFAVNPPVVVLTATGDQSLDTASLEDAINNLPAGGVLRLSGHFMIDHEIYSHGFDGTIEGDGPSFTVIEAVRGPGGFFEPVWQLPNGQPRTAIFVFDRTAASSLVIRDLTFKCDDPAPCPPTMMWSWPDPFTVMAAFVVDVFGQDRSTLIENVRFDGALASAPHAEGVHNCIIGVLSIQSTGSSRIAVQNSSLESIDIGVMAASHGPGSPDHPSSIVIDGLTGRDIGMLAYLPEVHCEATTVKNCQVTESGGIFPMIDVEFSENVEVALCRIANPRSPSVIYFTNSTNGLIRSNLIQLDDPAIPAIKLRNVTSTVVKANTVRGVTLVPLSVTGNSSGNRFLGNNFVHTEGGPLVYLGPEATNNILFGYSAGEVIDDVGDYTIWHNGEIMTQAWVVDGGDFQLIDLCAAGPAYMPDGEPGHYASGASLVFLWADDWTWGNWMMIPGHYVEVPVGTGDYARVPWGEIEFAPATWVGMPGTHDFVSDCTVVPKGNYVSGDGPMSGAN